MYINGSGPDPCGLNLLEDWESKNMCPVTHYMLAFVVGDSSGKLTMDQAMQLNGVTTDTTLINATVLRIMLLAQKNGKKVLLSMGGDKMGGSNSSVWLAFVNKNGGADKAADRIIAFLDHIKVIQFLTMDGVDFDYEPPGRVPKTDVQMIVDLTKALRIAIDKWYVNPNPSTPGLRAVISHAPQPPYICVPNNGCTVVPSMADCDADLANCAGAGYWYINEHAGDAIDFYFIQYYNNDYWDGVGTNTEIGARHVVNHVIGLTQGQGGFKPIPIEKIVVGKPACIDCGCGTRAIHGADCFMTGDQIINFILMPIQNALGSGVMPGVGFWQWGGLYGMQYDIPSNRLLDADLFKLGAVLNTLPSGITAPTSNTCPSPTDKTYCQTGGWGYQEEPIYCSDNPAECIYGKCMCKEGYYTNINYCDKQGTGTCTAGPNGFTCSGNGTCDWTTGDKCNCNNGWLGSDCSIPVEPLHCPPSATNQCSGHGMCNDSLECTCDFGFQGTGCTNTIPEVCILDHAAQKTYECGKYGSCNDDGTGKPVCTCIDNWTGDHCEIVPKFPYKTYNYCRRGGDPDSCSGHGLCSNQTLDEIGQATGMAPGTTDRKYQTDTTNWPNVASDENATCVCNKGWTGKWCQISADALACTSDGDCALTKNMYDIPYSCRDGFCQKPISTYGLDGKLIMRKDATGKDIGLYTATGAATTSNYCTIDPVTGSGCWGMCGNGGPIRPLVTIDGVTAPVNGIAAVPSFMFGERKVGTKQTPGGSSNATGAACGSCWKLTSNRLDDPSKSNTVSVVIGDRCGGGCFDKQGVHHDCSDFFAALPNPGGADGFGMYLLPDAIDPAARQAWLADPKNDSHPDWCAVGTHPHFDMDTATQRILCAGSGLENCLVDSFEQIPCGPADGKWPNGCDKTGYWSQNCPAS